LKIYIRIEAADVEGVREALKASNVNTWIMPDHEVPGVAPGWKMLKITTRSAAAMLNAGGVVNQWKNKKL
jgi:hypothetical protein